MLGPLGFLLNPPSGLAVTTIVGIGFILGLLHGATPDEHTWPITFSYAVGSFSTRGGMKSGFVFSAGFTIQRAILTTLAFVGLAAVYKAYDLDGPVYMIVGAVMFVAGSYILKGRYLHLPIDRLLGREHHTDRAERLPLHETEMKPVSMKMAMAHGTIAGWGVGGFAVILMFVLAPQLPSIIYAPLPGLAFGLGTMCMQVVMGAIFATLMRVKHLTVDQLKFVGRFTAGNTLYLGGAAFFVIGALILGFPFLDSLAVGTGNPIPNISSVGVSTLLVVMVVGVIGLGSMYRAYNRAVNGHPAT
ncbi:MAG: hypothetical protein JRN23_06545 [Nitrososphaerota archaeon]|jgi:hypothetical protein|nr:hypothetical protein [Nitrososphaerota archaeon]MDG6967478.1 hypothetical protein [Nitrososphaerota archaeon]MDG6978358.1 hypothetical protein [Nitrososphaerota archaeon]MDG7021573.1 hypothetical protein [Nitrososphaerota archaeon]